MESVDNPVAYALECGRSLLLWGANVDAAWLSRRLESAGAQLPVIEHSTLSAKQVEAPIVAVAVDGSSSAAALRALGEQVRARGGRVTVVGLKVASLRDLPVDLREYFSLCIGEEG